MNFLLIWIGAPFVFVPILFYFKPELFLGDESFSTEAAWSFLGLLFSYLGLVFSAYALKEVRNLTHRYFAKQRLPELKTQIEKIVAKMDELASKKLIDIRGEKFLGEARVVIKQLQKTKSPGFPEVVKSTKNLISKLETTIKSNDSKTTTVSDVAVYWDLYRSLSELSDEIRAYSLENKARL